MRTDRGDHTTYAFGALSDSAKETARSHLSERRESFLVDDITETFVSLLDEIGFENTERKGHMRWSLNHAQGDGVEFQTTIDIETFCEVQHEWAQGYWKPVSDPSFCALRDLLRRFHRPPAIDLSLRIPRYGYCEVDADVFVDDELGPRDRIVAASLQKTLGEIEDAVIEVYRTVCRWLQQIGYDLIEAYESDETIAEYCEANNIRFTHGGEIAERQRAGGDLAA